MFKFIVLLSVAAAAVSAQYCSLPYTNTPGDGLQYVEGLDWYGNDQSATANVANAYACYQLCLSQPATPAIVMWEYDITPGGNQVCALCRGVVSCLWIVDCRVC